MSETEEQSGKKRDMNWMYVMWYIHLHAFTFYTIMTVLFQTQWKTFFYCIFLLVLVFIGITVGAHRLWAHRSFSASWPVKLFLIIAHTMGGVGTVRNFALNHRLHHKYYGTEKDPFNHNEGFLYSHVLSNLCMPHPDHEEHIKEIDMSDLDNDNFVWFQHKFYIPLVVLFAFIIPYNTPIEYWDEDYTICFYVVGALRIMVATHIDALMNSSLLIWGLKPTEKYPPDDNWIFLLNRTFWPRYHYLLPWDWKTGEFGNYDYGLSSLTIKVLHELGFITNLKTADPAAMEDILYNVATKRITLEEGLEELRSKAEYEGLKETYEFHH